MKPRCQHTLVCCAGAGHPPASDANSRSAAVQGQGAARVAPHQALCSELLCHSRASLLVTGRHRKIARKCLATIQSGTHWHSNAFQFISLLPHTRLLRLPPSQRNTSALPKPPFQGAHQAPKRPSVPGPPASLPGIRAAYVSREVLCAGDQDCERRADNVCARPGRAVPAQRARPQRQALAGLAARREAPAAMPAGPECAGSQQGRRRR